MQNYYAESTQYLFQYSYPDYISLRDNIIKIIVIKYQDLKVDQELISFLQILLLADWINTLPDLTHFSPIFNTLIQKQQQIGWFSLIKYFWSIEWKIFNSTLQKQTNPKQEPQT